MCRLSAKGRVLRSVAGDGCVCLTAAPGLTVAGSAGCTNGGNSGNEKRSLCGAVSCPVHHNHVKVMKKENRCFILFPTVWLGTKIIKKSAERLQVKNFLLINWLWWFSFASVSYPFYLFIIKHPLVTNAHTNDFRLKRDFFVFHHECCKKMTTDVGKLKTFY